MSGPALYLEPVGGIAGDMVLGALIDVGASAEALRAALATLEVPGWRLEPTRGHRHHLHGTHVQVHVEGDVDHRHYTDIVRLIRRSGLTESVKAAAIDVFTRLGLAEAHIHGTTLEHIHFHEVGAVDAIIDICGAAVGLELLGWPEVYAAAPPLGSGTVTIAHGTVPVPVPATLELLKGRPVRFEGVGELTTPTGAALLAALTRPGPPPEMTVHRVGYGLGTRDLPERANVVRASLGTVGEARTAHLVLECTVDDCSPQVLGAVMDTLLARGALDVWVAPVVMKKSRPGHLVGVLCAAGERERMIATLLEETTTLGVRELPVSRTVLERRFEEVLTPWGPVKVKLGLRGQQVLNAAPEFEDCRALAEQAMVPLKDVIAAAMAAWARRP